MSDLCLNAKQALRSLCRAPGFTLTALLTLALGIGATTAMFSTLYAALWKPLPFRDPERLVLPRTTLQGRQNDFTSGPDFFDYQEQAQGFERLAVLAGPMRAAVTGGQAEMANLTLISPDFFPMVGTPPLAGRWYSAQESAIGGPMALVVSEGFARRRFGGPQDALGKVLTIPGQNLSAPIVGVSPASLDLFSPTDIWMPARKGDLTMRDSRGAHNWQVYGRLKSGVSIGSVQQEVDVIARRLEAQYPDTNKAKGLKVNPLQEALVGGERASLGMLMGGVSLLLLIACGNVAGLMLARGVARRGELAVRASLGASRGRILAQLLAESVLLSLCAGALGLVLAHLLLKVLPVVSGLAAQGIPAGSLDATSVLFMLGISALTGVLFGIVPAFRAASDNLAQDITQGRRAAGGHAGTRLRSALVAAQVALSLVLLVGSGMLMRSILQLHRTELGFDTRSLLTSVLTIPGETYREADRKIQLLEGIQAELRAIPGVKAAAFVSHLPLVHTGSNIGAWTPDRPPTNRTLGGDLVTANQRIVLPGYFQAMGIPLLAGRDISDGDGPAASQVMVISERMARTLFPGRSAIGQNVIVDRLGFMRDLASTTFQVVGVVANARIDAISQDTRPVMYLSFRQFAAQPQLQRMCPVIRTSLDPGSLAPVVSRIVSARDRDIPLDAVLSMEERISARLASRRVAATTLAMFSTVALLLASIGLYGVLAFLVGQRTREIGIRTALGADTWKVLWHFLRHGLVLTGAGLGAGILASLALGRILDSQLYRVSAIDPASMGLGSLALAAVALVASLVPAARAARVDPVVALRNE